MLDQDAGIAQLESSLKTKVEVKKHLLSCPFLITDIEAKIDCSQSLVTLVKPRQASGSTNSEGTASSLKPKEVVK